jgi:Zn-dependent protease
MRSTIPLGKWTGVPVGLHWSVALTVVLIASSLAESVLPELDTGETHTAYWVAGVIVALAFFLSLIAHELAHTVVARRHDVEVDSITLWLLGGVSQFSSEPDDPSVELRLSLAGPAMSLGLGALWWGLAAIVSVAGAPSIWVNSLLWLAFINLVLGVFNLLPAFPLDGGRVLRAIMWRQSDRLHATRTAVRVGRLFALVLVGFGVLLVFSGSLVSGTWFMLLGWFIDVAGRAELAGTVRHDFANFEIVAALMTTSVDTIDEGVSVNEFLHDHVLQRHHSAFPVMRDGSVTGMVSLENLRRVPTDEWSSTTVGDASTPLFGVPIIDPDTTVRAAMDEMDRLSATRALVFADRQLVGIVTHTDLIRALQVHELEVRALKSVETT